MAPYQKAWLIVVCYNVVQNEFQPAFNEPSQRLSASRCNPQGTDNMNVCGWDIVLDWLTDARTGLVI